MKIYLLSILLATASLMEAQQPVNRNLVCTTASGSGSAYSCSIPSTPLGYVTGQQYRIKSDVANTGTATINLNNLGPVTIQKVVTGTLTNLSPGDIGAGNWLTMTYNGSVMQLSSQISTPSYSVNVKTYGADPTGITDSSTAFNTALAIGNVTAIISCGTYRLNSTVTLSLPGQSLIGDGKGCVHINYLGTQSGIVWQMNPFTTNPAGEMSGFTLTCQSGAANGILSGQIVGSWMHDIDVSGCTSTGAAAIHLHNSGNLSTWTERNHYGPELSTGGIGFARNTYGFLLDSDNSGDSFGYNNFEDIKVNASTGQEGFRLASGFMYNTPQFNMVCNIENNVSGSVGPICIRSQGNWDGNMIQLHGEYQASGSGTGTPYSVQVDTGGRFSNLKGSNIDVLAPGGGQVSTNMLPAAASSPNVTLVQGTQQTSWDTGSFTLSGVATTPQPMQRANYGSIGLLIGNNIESPYVSIFQGTGNKFQFITVPTDGVIGNNGIDIGSVSQTGVFSGSFWNGQCNSLVSGCTGPGAIDGNAHQLLAGFTSAHRSGLANTYFQTATGINESMAGDPNFSGGWGFREGANIAHPIAWGYTLDPNDLEVGEKTFQSPLSSMVFSITHGGNVVPNGHINQGSTANIAGTCTLSSSTSCAYTFPSAFNSAPICVATPYFQAASSTDSRWFVTASTSSCTITYSLAQSGTVSFVAIGNPN